MKPSLRPFALTALGLALTLPVLHAGTEQTDSSITPVVSEQKSSIPISQEFNISGSYAAESLIRQGSIHDGNVDNINGHFDYVVSPQVKDGVLLRFGVDAERNSFGLPDNVSLPNTLMSTSLIIGADLALTDKILFRVELHPGIYSDFTRITGDDFDMPVQFGATYLYSKDLQIILGGQLDLKSNIPFVIIPGIRWQFADQWVLSLIPPKPQLQYEFSKSLTLYFGAEIIDGTYHLNDQFGTNHGRTTIPGQPNLNDKIVDFNEDRVGIGAVWKFMPNLSLDVSGGYIVYREFDVHSNKIGYNQRDVMFHQNELGGAPYGEVGISGSF